MIYGMPAEGTAAGAKVKQVDPSDGVRHETTAAGFVAQHEPGFAMRPLSDRRLGQFSQIVHH
jgi:hypothetical protein